MGLRRTFPDAEHVAPDSATWPMDHWRLFARFAALLSLPSTRDQGGTGGHFAREIGTAARHRESEYPVARSRGIASSAAAADTSVTYRFGWRGDPSTHVLTV